MFELPVISIIDLLSDRFAATACRAKLIGVIRYAITNRSSFMGDESARAAEVLRLAVDWGEHGLDFVQLREKDMGAKALTTLAREMVAALGPHTKLLVNGRVDVAVAAGAAGVHLTASPFELTAEQVRQVFAHADAGSPVVSVSCHTLADVDRARAAGADLILFGPVFEKRVDGKAVGEGLGTAMLRKACSGPTGVLALGGVTADNAEECLDAGAAGVAGIRLFGCSASRANL